MTLTQKPWVSFLVLVALLGATGCTAVSNGAVATGEETTQDATDLDDDDAQDDDGLAILELDAGLLGLAAPTIDADERVISQGGLRAGRIYSFVLREDGDPAASLECDGLPSSGVANVVVGDSSIHVDLGVQATTGSIELECETGEGDLSITLEYVASELAVVSSSMELDRTGSAQGSNPVVSPSGEWMVWVAAGSGGGAISRAAKSQVVARNLVDGRLLLLSSPDGETLGDGDSSSPAISADGQHVVFVSMATNLNDDSVAGPQVWRVDLDGLDEAPVLVTSADGTAAESGTGDGGLSPWISEDGRYVIFASDSDNYAAGTAAGTYQVYRKDMLNAAAPPVIVTSLDSTLANQAAARGDQSTTAFHASPDGRYVAFETAATNFVTGAALQQVYLKDMNLPAVAPAIASSEDSTQANQAAYRADAAASGARVSEDGRFIVFATAATNLVSSGANGLSQVYRKDLDDPAALPLPASSSDSTLADQTASLANSAVDSFSISQDGRYVAFSSSATNLFAGATGGQVYVKDMNVPGEEPAVASSEDSSQSSQATYAGDGDSSSATISPDGRYVYFASVATNFDTSANGDPRLYRKDLDDVSEAPALLGEFEPSSVFVQDTVAAAAGDESEDEVIAGSQVYVAAVASSEIALVQVVGATSGDHQADAQGNGLSGAVRVTPDGRYAVFESVATNLVNGTRGKQVFRKDLTDPTAPLVLVSSSDGTVAGQGDGDSSDPDISDDGRYVVFVSQATNLATGAVAGQVYLKDVGSIAVAPTLVSSTDSSQADQSTYQANASSSDPAISGDGLFVAFTTLASNLATGVAGEQVYRKSIAAPAVAPVVVSSLDSSQANQAAFMGNASSYAPDLSSDGRYVVFHTASTNFASNAAGTQVYRKDMSVAASAPLIVSTNNADSSADQTTDQGDLASTNSRISADGRYVFFLTASTNFVTNGSLVQLYRKDLNAITAAPRIVSSRDSAQPDQAAHKSNAAVTDYAISSDGRFAIFLTSASVFATTTGGKVQAYRKDMSAEATVPALLSSTNGAASGESDADATSAAISDDGETRLFASGASDLVSGIQGGQIFLK